MQRETDYYYKNLKRFNFDIQLYEHKLTYEKYIVQHQRERDYYSKNLSILNILSYSAVVETYLETLKSSVHEKL